MPQKKKGCCEKIYQLVQKCKILCFKNAKEEVEPQQNQPQRAASYVLAKDSSKNNKLNSVEKTPPHQDGKRPVAGTVQLQLQLNDTDDVKKKEIQNSSKIEAKQIIVEEIKVETNTKDEIIVKEIDQEEKKIIEQAIQTYQRNPRQSDKEDAAYNYASLSCIYIHEGNPSFEEYGLKALAIYQENESLFFEEIITLKNNIAFGKSKNFDKTAIQGYKEVLKMMQKYYSINDQRIFATTINLFVLFCNQNMQKQANELYSLKLKEKKNDLYSKQMIDYAENAYQRLLSRK